MYCAWQTRLRCHSNVPENEKHEQKKNRKRINAMFCSLDSFDFRKKKKKNYRKAQCNKIETKFN